MNLYKTILTLAFRNKICAFASVSSSQPQPELQVELATGYALRLFENNDMLGPVLDKPYRKAGLAKIFGGLEKK
ncbi:MAG: hypothetical protein ACI9IN_001729 [Porticoccaceae bacterium]|jgi:hypothetical protein